MKTLMMNCVDVSGVIIETCERANELLFADAKLVSYNISVMHLTDKDIIAVEKTMGDWPKRGSHKPSAAFHKRTRKSP